MWGPRKKGLNSLLEIGMRKVGTCPPLLLLFYSLLAEVPNALELIQRQQSWINLRSPAEIAKSRSAFGQLPAGANNNSLTQHGSTCGLTQLGLFFLYSGELEFFLNSLLHATGIPILKGQVPVSQPCTSLALC